MEQNLQNPRPTPPTGRLAPTPSGRMHLGNAFAALLAWLAARSAGGRILLRMENLDLLRTTADFAEDIKADFAWLGLDWDKTVLPTNTLMDAPPTPGGAGGVITSGLDADGVLWQGARGAFYEAQVAKLAEAGLVYPCFCSRAQLHAAEAPHASDGNYVYDGRCRTLSPDEVAEKLKTRGAALRVRVPDTTITIADQSQGKYAENLRKDCGDFILRRSDGVFAYQLAAPADDAVSGVTQIVRGRDLLPSAPRQLWLMRTLGLLGPDETPEFAHLPLLLAPDGRRLAKRDADLDLSAIRANIKSPERLVGLLAHLAGLLEKPRPVTAAELLDLFDWKRLRKEDIVVTPKLMEVIE